MLLTFFDDYCNSTAPGVFFSLGDLICLYWKYQISKTTLLSGKWWVCSTARSNAGMVRQKWSWKARAAWKNVIAAITLWLHPSKELRAQPWAGISYFLRCISGRHGVWVLMLLKFVCRKVRKYKYNNTIQNSTKTFNAHLNTLQHLWKGNGPTREFNLLWGQYPSVSAIDHHSLIVNGFCLRKHFQEQSMAFTCLFVWPTNFKGVSCNSYLQSFLEDTVDFHPMFTHFYNPIASWQVENVPFWCRPMFW
jgi:hypothetical protein